MPPLETEQQWTDVQIVHGAAAKTHSQNSILTFQWLQLDTRFQQLDFLCKQTQIACSFQVLYYWRRWAL